jgi:hypothetical protein
MHPNMRCERSCSKVVSFSSLPFPLAEHIGNAPGPSFIDTSFELLQETGCSELLWRCPTDHPDHMWGSVLTRNISSNIRTRNQPSVFYLTLPNLGGLSHLGTLNHDEVFHFSFVRRTICTRINAVTRGTPNIWHSIIEFHPPILRSHWRTERSSPSTPKRHTCQLAP